MSPFAKDMQQLQDAGVLPTTGQIVTDEEVLHDMRMDLEEQQR